MMTAVRWLDDCHIEGVCGVCKFQGKLLQLLEVPHLLDENAVVKFVRCPQCDSLSNVDSILSFDHIQEGSLEAFLRQYVESTAGLWEMYWPVAIVGKKGKSSLLDVGCGFGFTADIWLHTIHEEAFGCDPAEYARAGQHLLGQHIQPYLLDEVESLSGKQFNVVYASEVIEHVPDPISFVDMMVKRLTSDGVLVLTTPAAEYISSANDPASVVGALAPGFHGFLFSRNAMESLLKSAGFAHVIVERHGERLLAWASMEAMQRKTQEEVISDYLCYLDEKFHKTNHQSSDSLASLNSGIAYRRFKEHLLRGRAAPPILRQQKEGLLTSVLIRHNASVMSVEDISKIIHADPTAVGVAFGAVARYHFPQTAFVCGCYYASIEPNVNIEKAWLELSMSSAEKLCASTVLQGLEAAAFYWQAMLRLLPIQSARAEYELMMSHIAHGLESLVAPTPRIGGGAIDGGQLAAVFDALIDGYERTKSSQALRKVIEAMEPHVSPSYLTTEVLRNTYEKHVLALNDFLRFVLQAMEGSSDAKKSGEQLLVALNALPVLSRDAWVKTLKAMIEKRLQKLSAPTFASLSSGGGWGSFGYR